MARVYTAFAITSGGTTVPVLYALPDGYGFLLATCTRCGQVFAFDPENPRIGRKPVRAVVGEQKCPKCGERLANTLENYPESFVEPDGSIGHFSPSSLYPPDEQSRVVELPELEPQ